MTITSDRNYLLLAQIVSSFVINCIPSDDLLLDVYQPYQCLLTENITYKTSGYRIWYIWKRGLHNSLILLTGLVFWFVFGFIFKFKFLDSMGKTIFDSYFPVLFFPDSSPKVEVYAGEYHRDLIFIAISAQISHFTVYFNQGKISLNYKNI